MGQVGSNLNPNAKKDANDPSKKKEKRRLEAAPPTHFGKKKKRSKGSQASAKLPAGMSLYLYMLIFFPFFSFIVFPTGKCLLRLKKSERIKDFLLIEEEVCFL